MKKLILGVALSLLSLNLFADELFSWNTLQHRFKPAQCTAIADKDNRVTIYNSKDRFIINAWSGIVEWRRKTTSCFYTLKRVEMTSSSIFMQLTDGASLLLAYNSKELSTAFLEYPTQQYLIIQHGILNWN